jgi:hypothetical protein
MLPAEEAGSEDSEAALEATFEEAAGVREAQAAELRDAETEAALRTERRVRALLLTSNLLPFLLAPRAWIGALVFVHGALCHNARAFCSERTYRLARDWDVGCNVLLVLFVNAHTAWQPQTLLLTDVATAAWLANNAWLGQSMWVHALAVQWPLCVACLRF